MGAWSTEIFGNDTATDWVYGLEGATDLALIEEAIDSVLENAGQMIAADQGCECLAACEALARQVGRPGSQDSYSESLDEWVRATPLEPEEELLERAGDAARAILSENSELAGLWDRDPEWIASVEGLIDRLSD